MKYTRQKSKKIPSQKYKNYSYKKRKRRAQLRLLSLLILMACIILIISTIFINVKKSVSTNADLNNNIDNTTVDYTFNETQNENDNNNIIQVFLGNEDSEASEQSTASPIPSPPQIIGDITKDTFYVKVNTIANVVNVYIKDEAGNYTTPYKVMVCSTGRSTPKTGKYELSDKLRWHALFGNVYGQYCSRITGNILFHSVPYTKQSPDSLEYEEYDKLGTSASSGCVRLTVEDTKWIYDNCPKGTYIEFYGDENPGPLGKPTISPISSNKEYRNWDPTDIWSEGNPWNASQ